MYAGQKYIRDNLIAKLEEEAASDKATESEKAAIAKFLETKDSTVENSKAVDALIPELEKAAKNGCPIAPASKASNIGEVCQDEMKAAVKVGYWNLFSFNPALKAEGKNPFTLTSKAGDGTYQAFLNNETRYSALTRKFPERAKVLFDRNEQAAKDRFVHLQKLVELYK